jgi:hypothetical protein
MWDHTREIAECDPRDGLEIKIFSEASDGDHCLGRAFLASEAFEQGFDDELVLEDDAGEAAQAYARVIMTWVHVVEDELSGSLGSWYNAEPSSIPEAPTAQAKEFFMSPRVPDYGAQIADAGADRQYLGVSPLDLATEWHPENNFFLCAEGEEASFGGRVRFLAPDEASGGLVVDGIDAAAEGLNTGAIRSGSSCVALAVRCTAHREYRVLYRRGRRAEALSQLGLCDEEAEDDDFDSTISSAVPNSARRRDPLADSGGSVSGWYNAPDEKRARGPQGHHGAFEDSGGSLGAWYQDGGPPLDTRTPSTQEYIVSSGVTPLQTPRDEEVPTASQRRVPDLATGSSKPPGDSAAGRPWDRPPMSARGIGTPRDKPTPQSLR